ncbi:MFS transporter [Halomonas sp. PR-M31]|uniref:spinster family MFS transporter n=1 Tax=Halomonas sp. PR-M31 TaxID=1471202 RepID=UPI0006510977|nr:MFS transporter [Halomonas sp. PR-M31]
MTHAPATISPWRRHALLLVLTLLYTDNFIGRQVLAVMIEPIKQEFGVSDSAMGLVSGLAFAGVYAIFGLAGGHLADRVSRTRLLAICALCWGVATILCGFAVGFYVLVLARMLVAVVEAPVTASSLSMIADLYPPQRRSFAISCFTTAPTLAAIVALSLGAWLVELQGWRFTFMLVGVPALVLSLLLAFLVHEPQRGAWDPAPSLEVPVQGMLGSARSLWSQPAYRTLIIASAVTTLGANAYGMWNATFLVRIHDLELREAGTLAGIIGGGSAALGMLFGGWLTDRFVRRHPSWQLRIPQIGHLIGIFAMLNYLLWPSDWVILIGGFPVPAAMLWCGVNGFFAVWWVGPLLGYITQLVTPHTRGTALAIQTIMVTLFGVGLGPLSIGILSDLLIPYFDEQSLRYALLFCVFTTIIAMLLIWRVMRMAAQTDSENAVDDRLTGRQQPETS